MKTTLAITALLLVVVSALPLQDTPLKGELFVVLVPKEIDSSLVLDLEPLLLQEILRRQYLAPDLEVNQDYEPPRQTVDEETTHDRRKRQTSVSGGVTTDTVDRDGRRISGTINVDRKVNKHTLGGSLKVDHTRFPGVSGTDFGAKIGYTFKPNKNTSFNAGATRNWGASGSSTGFGVGFKHTFGRKRRSTANTYYN
ncbi:uncharacterized protein LOC121858355 [Homarus americanus]|uniref:Uncharacterized protein n=1 Tax=Homarus americanus TaxID=6706 RepID=A0A8J5N9N6_HOMAM|nr:uncharacterized protein LOC121858355 [Homarus americanus]KAG7175419.1 hypothetical protein Hamer_G001507 [Homarus americanus]